MSEDWIYEEMDGRDDPAQRYGAYKLGGDGKPFCVMATSLEGIGGMLRTLAEDDREHALSVGKPYVVPVVGILDRRERKWLTSLWHPTRL